jgi:FMN phosphatase YigB (HAD superfamily)
MYSVVTFDLWFTLIYEDDYGSELFRRKRIDVLYNMFNKYSDIRWSDVEVSYDSTRYIRMTIPNRSLIRYIALSLGIDPDNLDLDTATEMYEKSVDGWLPHINREAYNVLKVLKQDYDVKIGVISNTSLSRRSIEIILENLGLCKYIDLIVSSSDVGFIKPMPQIFEEVSKSFDVKPGDVIHIGDNYLDDYIGAKNFGAYALLYTGLWDKYRFYSPFKNKRLELPSCGKIDSISLLGDVFKYIR